MCYFWMRPASTILAPADQWTGDSAARRVGHVRSTVWASAGLTIGLLVVPAASQAMVNIKVRPAKPIVDEDITVSFKTDRKLKSGYHYEGTVVGARGSGCANFVLKASGRKPGKGKPMSFHFSPYDDIVNGDSGLWCQGRSFVNVSIERDSGKGVGNLIGDLTLRFYGRP